MLKLAEQFAKLKQTHILAHKETEDGIIFVLASGPKLTMSEQELKTEIDKLIEAKIEKAEAVTAPGFEGIDEAVKKETAKPKSKGKK